MFPRFMINNTIYDRRRNIKHFCYFSLVTIIISMKTSYFQYLFISKFAIIAFCSMGHSAMLIFIKMIIGYCVPSQIIKSAMGWNTIVMASFISGGGRADKGEKDEPVNMNTKILAIFSQRNAWIRAITRMRFKNLLRSGDYQLSVWACSIIRPYSPLVRDFVSGKAENWFPNFYRGVKMFFSHGGSLLSRESLGLGPMRRMNAV